MEKGRAGSQRISTRKKEDYDENTIKGAYMMRMIHQAPGQGEQDIRFCKSACRLFSGHKQSYL